MAFEDELKAHLQGDSVIADLVADRIVPLIREQGTGLPAITYQRISGRPVNALIGFTSALWEIREQLDLWAMTHADVIALNAAVKERMDTPATNFKALLNINMQSYDVDAKLYRFMMDFSCFWTET